MPRRELAGKPSQARVRIWRAMRMLRAGFKVGELIAIAGVRRKAAEKFMLPLVRAQYLRAAYRGPARRYWLIRDTGPIPPRVVGAGVLDLNLEIARDRTRHAELIKEIRAVEARLMRMGAYVEKYSAEAKS
jgi:hypothetical protein